VLVSRLMEQQREIWIDWGGRQYGPYTEASARAAGMIASTTAVGTLRDDQRCIGEALRTEAERLHNVSIQIDFVQPSPAQEASRD
jgi:hypothetical protein